VTISASPRLGLTQWSSDSDPVNRSQFETSFANIDQFAAVDNQGVFGARPAYGTVGRYYFCTDTGALYRDTGASWVQINPPGVVQVPHTWNLTGQIQVQAGANGYIGPMFVPVPTGQSVTLTGIVAVTRSGTATVSANHNGTPISGLSAVGVTTTSTGRVAPSTPTSFADLDMLAPAVTAISGTPDGLTVTAFLSYTFPA
jgi:hypothetical protein